MQIKTVFIRLISVIRIYWKSGAGGVRTLVQTGNVCAFYMLIPAFIVGRDQDPDHQVTPYPLKFHPRREAVLGLFPIYLHRRILGLGITTSGRCLVAATLSGD